jgi:hypothetical protein
MAPCWLAGLAGAGLPDVDFDAGGDAMATVMAPRSRYLQEQGEGRGSEGQAGAVVCAMYVGGCVGAWVLPGSDTATVPQGMVYTAISSARATANEGNAPAAAADFRASTYRRA